MGFFDDNPYVPPNGNTGIAGGMPSGPVDYQQQFWNLIGRQPGQSADDWASVLTNSGIGAGVGPGQQATGLTQQIGAGGVRGRVFLPTDQADALGYYAHPYDVIADDPNNPGHFVWAWNDKGFTPGGGAGAAGGFTGTIGQGLESSPGYQFRLGEGLKALERSAAARGTLLTGGTLKGIQRYAQDYASGEYDKRVGQLTGLANLGLGAAGGMNSAGSAYANQGSELLQQAGNAQAAGRVGAANANAGMLGNFGNIALTTWLMHQMGGRGGATPPYFGQFGGWAEPIYPGITPTMTSPID
jgi:hypothetical protein